MHTYVLVGKLLKLEKDMLIDSMEYISLTSSWDLPCARRGNTGALGFLNEIGSDTEISFGWNDVRTSSFVIAPCMICIRQWIAARCITSTAYVFEAAGEQGEGEVAALVDELEPDGALAPVHVVHRVVGVLILQACNDSKLINFRTSDAACMC